MLNLLSAISISNPTSMIDQDFSLFLVIFGLLSSLSILYTNFKLFEKAGENGWAMFIPFYDVYVLTRISQRPQVLSILAYFLIASHYAITSDFGIYGTIKLIVDILLIILFIYVFVGYISQYKAGHIFWILYFLFPIATIFMVHKVVTRTESETKIDPNAPKYPNYSTYTRPPIKIKKTK